MKTSKKIRTRYSRTGTRTRSSKSKSRSSNKKKYNKNKRTLKKKYNKNKRTLKKKYKTKKHHILGKGGVYDTLFLNCYDKNLEKVQNAIREYSGTHTVDRTIAERFIDRQISDVRKQAARDLIENTIYITLEEVSHIIEQLIIKLYTENDLNSAEFIYIYTGKPSKSFYFISILALYYIRLHGFKQPTHFITSFTNDVFDDIGDSPLIILDDVSYSGSQLSNMLHNIYYDRVIKQQKIVPNIFVLLVALNNISRLKLSKVPINKKTPRQFIQSPFKLLYLPERLYMPLLLILGIERYFYLNTFFSPYTTPFISLYLDHKIADEASTYTTALLYGAIVPSNYDYNYYFTVIENQFQIINNSLENSENAQLLTDFNNSNNTTFNNIGMYDIINYLVKKIVEIDIYDKDILTNNIFEPFINNCNRNPKLLENISDPEIINFNYSLFTIPSGCLIGNKNECVVSGYTLETFIESYFELPTSISKEDAVRISDKINSIKCPISWYKNGDFQMTCTSLV